MVRHIVMWNLQECAAGADKEHNAAKIKEKLEGLVGKIEGLQKLEVGRNIVPNGYDLCLYSEFDDMEALDFYRTHPLHMEIQKFVHEVITERVFSDCEI